MQISEFQNLSDFVTTLPTPLSLEKLVTMEGEPVWICLENNSYQFSGWAIVFEISSGGVFLQFNAGCEQLPISEYTRTWVAFDHKPDMTVYGTTGQGQPFLDKLRSMGQLPDLGPISVKIPSDYDPNTLLRLTRTDDGDIIFKIVGNGEMRIATSGGMLRGLDLVAVTSAFSKILDIYKNKDDGSEKQEPKWEYRKYIRTGLLSPSGEFIALETKEIPKDVYFDIIERYQYPEMWKADEETEIYMHLVYIKGWVLLYDVLSKGVPMQAVVIDNKLTLKQEKFLAPYFEHRHDMPPVTEVSSGNWYRQRNYI